MYCLLVMKAGGDMKKRSADILLDLLETRKKICFDKLSEQYQVSERTLRKDIKEINDFLETIGQCDLQIDVNGKITLDKTADCQVIRDELYKIDLYMYRMMQAERCIYIIVLLATQIGYMTMEKIAEELFVSRLTVINDIELVKQQLKDFDIETKTKSSKGIFIQYKEENLRLLLISLFHKIITNVRNKGIFQQIILRKLNEKYPLPQFVKYIQQFEINNDLLLNETVFYQNALYLSVAFNRMATGKYIISKQEHVENGDNYAEDLLNFISFQIGVGINENEKLFYKQYIMRNHLDAITKKGKDAELSSIIIYFLSKIGNEIDIPFQEDRLLLQSLLQHIKSVIGQDEFYIDIDEEEAPSEYQEIFGAVRKHVYILERYLNESLTDNMMKAIVIHICASLIRSRADIEKLSVLIACPGSVATGKLLEAQVKNYFDFNIVGVVPVRRVYDEVETKGNIVDFVISTVAIENLTCPILMVNPVLEINDLNAIQKQAFILGRLISRNNGGTVQNESQTKLKKMLTANHIVISNEMLSYEEGIRLVGNILGKEYYTVSYIDKMLENVKKYGPYIILSPGVALAHASAENGVHKEGLSLLVSKKGIVFDGDVKVYLLFCFCTRGDETYLELFHEIMDLGRSERVEKVIQKHDCEGVYKELITGT